MGRVPQNPKTWPEGFLLTRIRKKICKPQKTQPRPEKIFQNLNQTFGNPIHHYISLQIFYDAAGFQNELKFGKS